MRPVNIADLEVGARVLLATPAARRPALARSLCERAHEADRYRHRTKTPHPVLGAGTLMAACSAYRKALRGTFEAHDFLRCMHILVSALIDFEDDHRP